MTTGGQGKYIRYRIPSGEEAGDIALIPTILSALSHSTDGRVKVSKRDYRIKVKRKKISTHTLIILDVSSSMMEGNKLRLVKRCLDEIFLDTYQKRDRIALITAGGERADYLLPFTSNIEKGRALIDSIGFGGTTPLSSAINSGLRVLEDIMRKEPWLVPIMVIITDGGANVPLRMGGNIKDEFSILSSELDYIKIRPLVINVGEDSPMLEEIVWKTDGKYLSITTEEKTLTDQIEHQAEIRKVLHEILLALAGNVTNFSVFDGYKRETISEVKEILEDNPINIEFNQDCHFGCSPTDAPSELCRECRLKLGSLDQELRPAKIRMISEHHTKEDLMGDIFVRYLSTHSEFVKANNGILVLEDESAFEKFSDILKDVYGNRSYKISNDEYTETVPFKPKGIFLCREKGYMDIDEGIKLHKKNEDISEMMWKIDAVRKFKTDPIKFMNDLRSEREETIQRMNELLQGTFNPEVPEYIEGILEDNFEINTVKDIIRSMRASAALVGRDKTGLEDLERALKDMGLVINTDESRAYQYLFTKLNLLLSAKDELRLCLIDGYGHEEFMKAIDLLSKFPINIEVPKGCTSNCDPQDYSCPECNLRWDNNEMEVTEIPLPIVHIRGDETLEELRGELFVKYQSTSDILIKANRGLLVIDSIKDMSPEVVEFLDDLMYNGFFTVKNDEYTHIFKTEFSIIARRDSLKLNDLVQNYLGYRISKESYEDILPSIIDEDNMSETHEKTLQRMEETLSLDVDIPDDLLDYLVRACLELGLSRFDVEMKIERLARVISRWNGAEEVSRDTMEHSMGILLPAIR